MFKGYLSSGFAFLWRMCRLWRWVRVALPGVGEAGAGGPVAAGEVGDGDQGLPGVGGPVFQRHLRGGVLEFVEPPAGPAGELVAELVEGWGVAAGAVGVDVFGGSAPSHPDDHGPV